MTFSVAHGALHQEAKKNIKEARQWIITAPQSAFAGPQLVSNAIGETEEALRVYTLKRTHLRDALKKLRDAYTAVQKETSDLENEFLSLAQEEAALSGATAQEVASIAVEGAQQKRRKQSAP